MQCESCSRPSPLHRSAMPNQKAGICELRVNYVKCLLTVKGLGNAVDKTVSLTWQPAKRVESLSAMKKSMLMVSVEETMSCRRLEVLHLWCSFGTWVGYYGW